MSHVSRNMEDFVAVSDLNCADLTQEVSMEKNFSMWPRGHFCAILVKNVATFCPCLKSLPEAKVKRIRLIALKKEGSEKPSKYIFLWFILILMKNILIKHSKLKKKKYKIYGSSNKEAGGTQELNLVFKEINRLRE